MEFENAILEFLRKQPNFEIYGKVFRKSQLLKDDIVYGVLYSVINKNEAQLKSERLILNMELNKELAQKN